MPVPLLDLKFQNLALESELTAAFQRVLRSGHYILGGELDRFEADLAEFLGVRHALGVSSGTDAIQLALMALGLGRGDEVVVPSFTFFATAAGVSRVGAIPVFADVCPACFNLDPQDAVRRVTSRTRALMPVHLFGQSAELDPLMTLASSRGLKVIEDAAQSLGSRYGGRPVGGFGAFGAFSFFPSKNLGALGDAGLLVTNDDELAERARLLRVHGAKPKYYHHLVGANFRMDALQAALLSVKLPRYAGYTAARVSNATDYTARLSRVPGVALAGPCRCASPGPYSGIQALADKTARLVLPVTYTRRDHIWNQYTVRVPGDGRRDALRAHLTTKGIGSEIYYPVPLHAQPCFAGLENGQSPLPVSDQLAREVLSLPIYPELTAEQREEVADGISTFLSAGGWTVPRLPMEYFVVPERAHDELVAAAFAYRGFKPDEVAPMVRLCREAARHGIRTHNALKALHLDELFGSRVGGCVPGAEIEELPVRFPAARVWNAHRKLGPGVGYQAMEVCIGLAQEFGLGMVSVDEAWHYLWGGAYVLEAARRGFIGYTNCTAMLAEVVPFRGRRPTLGTNPHSWAFPTIAAVGFPILVDFATSSVAMGRVQQFAREGRSLPPGSAVDAEGVETVDPVKAAALLPFGGHKGYGLGLLDELFGGIIGGWLPTLRGRFANGGDAKRTSTFFFLAMHPDAISGGRHTAGAAWPANIKAVLADVLGPGNEGAVLPGQPEADMARRSADAGGLLFTQAELSAFDAIAGECGRSAWEPADFATVTMG